MALLSTSGTACADGESSAGYNFSVSINPISFSRKDKEKDIDYEIALSKNDTSTSDFSVDFQHNSQKTVDTYTDVTTTSNDAVLTIDYSLTPQDGIFSYTSEYIFERSHEGHFYDKRYEGTISPLGLKASFFRKNPKINEFSLSYYPEYNILKHDVKGMPGQTRIERSLQHKLSLIHKAQLTDNFDIDSELDRIYLIPGNDDANNVRDKSLTLDMYKLTNQVSLTYEFTWRKDDRVGRLFSEEEIDSTHSLNITYSTDLFKH